MNTLPLERTPNQRFGIRLDGSRYEIWLKKAVQAMCVTITRDEVTLVSGARCVAGTPLVPYAYLAEGNFIFLTENDELPDWELFGRTQTLVYVSAAELVTLGG